MYIYIIYIYMYILCIYTIYILYYIVYIYMQMCESFTNDDRIKIIMSNNLEVNNLEVMDGSAGIVPTVMLVI